VLKPWTEELVTLGSRVIAKRLQFLQTFSTYLTEAYQQIEAVAEKPSIEYDTIDDLPPDATAESVAEIFREELDRVAQRERERGTTLVGPQRDELIFRLDEFEVRRYGSQGQHRTFGMALKLAQYFFLQDELDEQPLLLLDDAFGKLDPDRSAVFLELLQSDSVGQSLVTATRREPFEETVPFDEPAHRAIEITKHQAAETAVP
jgi:DNA replication and repair protein RecF